MIKTESKIVQIVSVAITQKMGVFSQVQSLVHSYCAIQLNHTKAMKGKILGMLYKKKKSWKKNA